LGSGLFWASAEAKANFGARSYCPPEDLILHTQNYRDMLDRSIEKRKDYPTIKRGYDKDILGLLLLLELQETFPCNKK
jgi:hypothetical protein